jgi:predicted Fe-S protein YdhL (DUF1289 family)
MPNHEPAPRDSQGRTAQEILNDWKVDDPEEVAIIEDLIRRTRDELFRWKRKAQGPGGRR